jgi:hypothetical protein
MPPAWESRHVLCHSAHYLREQQTDLQVYPHSHTFTRVNAQSFAIMSVETAFAIGILKITRKKGDNDFTVTSVAQAEPGYIPANGIGQVFDLVGKPKGGKPIVSGVGGTSGGAAAATPEQKLEQKLVVSVHAYCHLSLVSHN